MEAPAEGDAHAILEVLRAFNVSRAGPARQRPVALFLLDADGNRVGGLWGRCSYDWMFVELLAVPEEHRGVGLGAALMRNAEEIAVRHGCVGIWLDTFEFQARGFYEKLGFEVFGQLDDHPVGNRSFFLRKRLSSVTP